VRSGSGTAAILRELLEASSRREPVVLATVVHTSRSVPRRPGSKMLVYASGRTSGTVGGGEMEARVVAECLAALGDGRPRRLAYSLVDPARGDPGVCGGDVELYLEPHMPTSTLFVAGLGHVGRAVVELARWLDHRILAWDDRTEVGAAVDGDLDVGPDGVLHRGRPLAEALAETPIDAATRVVLVTRNPGLDLELLPLILATPAPFVGLMGSDRRWHETRARLTAAGVSEADLARVHTPVGLEIRAETPAEIAVSILAQVIAHERG
jgi:xanthine dehydrogenase accessory factor